MIKTNQKSLIKQRTGDESIKTSQLLLSNEYVINFEDLRVETALSIENIVSNEKQLFATNADLHKQTSKNTNLSQTEMPFEECRTPRSVFPLLSTNQAVSDKYELTFTRENDKGEYIMKILI